MLIDSHVCFRLLDHLTEDWSQFFQQQPHHRPVGSGVEMRSSSFVLGLKMVLKPLNSILKHVLPPRRCFPQLVAQSCRRFYLDNVGWWGEEGQRYQLLLGLVLKCWVIWCLISGQVGSSARVQTSRFIRWSTDKLWNINFTEQKHCFSL